MASSKAMPLSRIVMNLMLSLTTLLLNLPETQACSSFHFPVADHTMIGRAMELGGDCIHWDIVSHNVNESIRSMPLLPKAGFEWSNKNGFVNVEASLAEFVFCTAGIRKELNALSFGMEGINEKGLTVSAHTHHQAVYQTNSVDNASSLEWIMLVPWVLGNFDSVQQVRNQLRHTSVIDSFSLLPSESRHMSH